MHFTFNSVMLSFFKKITLDINICWYLEVLSFILVFLQVAFNPSGTVECFLALCVNPQRRLVSAGIYEPSLRARHCAKCLPPQNPERAL